MAVLSSFNLKGVIDIVGGRRKGDIGLSTVIDGIEIKDGEAQILASSGWVVVPLNFNSGVTEVLVIHVYSPSPLLIELTDVPGDTVQVGLKGHGLWTFTPGAGITSIRAKNESASVNTTLELTYGVLQNADDEPDYWKE